MKFKVEHLFKNKFYIVTANDEQTAWEYFLDYKLPLKDNSEDYTIQPA